MSQFEDDLRAALRREQPPEDFAARVMVRTRRAPRRAPWVAAAIAASLLLGAGRYEYQQYQGRKAKRELLIALQITESKLKFAQQKVNELSRRTIHD